MAVGSNISRKVVIRPQKVEYAIKLMLTAIAIGALVGYISIPVEPGHEYFRAYIYIALLGILMNGYLAYKVAQNRDWARKLYIILTITTFGYYLPKLFSLFTSSIINGILQLLVLLMQLAAVYLLLSKEAREWFLLVKRRK